MVEEMKEGMRGRGRRGCGGGDEGRYEGKREAWVWWRR